MRAACFTRCNSRVGGPATEALSEKPSQSIGLQSCGLGRRISGLSAFGRRVCERIATWLILPVVICLSQRLSHACLSMNCFIL